MEIKELKIQIPEGFEIDKENSTFENIVFKKIDDKSPTSWKEYCKEYKGTPCCIPDRILIDDIYLTKRYGIFYEFETKEKTKAFAVLGQLIQLRDAWIGDWKPDWTNGHIPKYCIINDEEHIITGKGYALNKILAFPTEKMRDEFYACFKDLIEKAKMFL